MEDVFAKEADGVLSLEGILVKSFFIGLDRLQSTWMGESFDQKKFNLQLLYLIRTVPDRKTQKKILENWDRAQRETKAIPGLDERETVAYVGMEVVTEIIMFVCSAFELINTDITGPATTKQMQRASIEVPDYEEPNNGDEIQI
jgi:hypothetical protein